MGLDQLDTVLAFSVVMLLLSLVITTGVQITVAVLGTRGRNLRWGLIRLIERAGLQKAEATTIAEKVLAHPSVGGDFGSTWWRRAKAIGSEELVRVLKDLAAADDTDAALKASLAELLEPTAGLEPDQARAVRAQFQRLFPDEAAKVDAALDLVDAKASELSATVDAWFDSVMNRTTDRFIAHTRIVTVGLSLGLAVVLQVDSLAILRQLSTDAELRASLVAVADQTIADADAMLSETSIAAAAVDAIADSLPGGDTLQLPASLVTRDEGRRWISARFAGVPRLDQRIVEYEESFDSITRVRLPELGARVVDLRSQVEESRLVVIPATWEAWAERAKSTHRHVPGLLLTVILLSLGAPFWFNALRSLAALRPVLAGRVDPSKH